VSGQNFERTT